MKLEKKTSQRSPARNRGTICKLIVTYLQLKYQESYTQAESREPAVQSCFLTIANTSSCR